MKQLIFQFTFLNHRQLLTPINTRLIRIARKYKLQRKNRGIFSNNSVHAALAPIATHPQHKSYPPYSKDHRCRDRVCRHVRGAPSVEQGQPEISGEEWKGPGYLTVPFRR